MLSTRIQEEGASAAYAQVQTGHSLPDLTREYAVITKKKRVRAVKRFQKKLLAKRTDWSPEGGLWELCGMLEANQRGKLLGSPIMVNYARVYTFGEESAIVESLPVAASNSNPMDTE